jgi:hypothetical protein
MLDNEMNDNDINETTFPTGKVPGSGTFTIEDQKDGK